MRNIKLLLTGIACLFIFWGCTPKTTDAGPGEDPNKLSPFRTAEGKWGYQNGRGKTVIEATFDNVTPFRNGIARIKVKDKYGYIDESGKSLIEAKYEEAGFFNQGLCPVKVDGKFGYIDRTGKMKFEAKFESAESFGLEFAAVTLGGKAGYIDKEGKFTEGEVPGDNDVAAE